MANNLLDADNLDAAHREITKALALRPDFAQSYSSLAFILAKQGRLNDAMEASLKAVENYRLSLRFASPKSEQYAIAKQRMKKLRQ